MTNELRKKHRKLLIILICGVLLMFGFCYMLVPLYELICKQEGINGKSVNAASAYDVTQIDRSRTIRVYFTTTLHSRVSFKFIPLQRFIDIHPGERKLIYFYAENRSNKAMTVQAIPSITPMDGARFLKKTECFCFTQQYFFKGEKADMPVYFFIEPTLPRSIQEITLSYTLFDVEGYIKKQPHFTKGRIDL